METALPIIQAPMAGAQDSRLAIAVSNAGGLGSLPCAMLSPGEMQQELRALTAGTSQPWCANCFCHQLPERDPEAEAAWRRLLDPYYQEFEVDAGAVSHGPLRTPFNHDFMDILAPFRPPVISFHFGLPSADLLARAKATGARIISSATTVAEALWLESHGASAVIVQGWEAGGHRGNFLGAVDAAPLSTFELLPAIAAAVSIPVIAAGGICEASAVASARSLGAVAVQVGTAYLACPEAATNPVHRAAILQAPSRGTAVTRLFTGRPARGVVNRLMRRLGSLDVPVPAFPYASLALAPLRAAAERRGDDGFSPLWCGSRGVCSAARSAEEITVALLP